MITLAHSEPLLTECPFCHKQALGPHGICQSCSVILSPGSSPVSFTYPTQTHVYSLDIDFNEQVAYRKRSPEFRLIAAVFTHLILDINLVIRGRRDSGLNPTAIRADILCPSEDPFSLRFLCSVLKLNYHKVRDRFLRALDEKEAIPGEWRYENVR